MRLRHDRCGQPNGVGQLQKNSGVSLKQRGNTKDSANHNGAYVGLCNATLSPAGTFIAANYNLPFDVDAFVQAGRQLLDEVERALGWMYETLHTDGRTKGRIEYTVWSEVFSCPNCAGEMVFLDAPLDEKTKRVKDTFPCPHCGAESYTKSRMERLYETCIDPVLNTIIRTPRRRPVLVSYKVVRLQAAVQGSL